MLIMMTTEPQAKESMIAAVAVILIILLTAVEVVMMLMLHLSFSPFENLKFLGRFGADLRILTPYRVELIDKRLIFGLGSTTN